MRTVCVDCKINSARWKKQWFGDELVFAPINKPRSVKTLPFVPVCDRCKEKAEKVVKDAK
jgi:hypothetical protein